MWTDDRNPYSNKVDIKKKELRFESLPRCSNLYIFATQYRKLKIFPNKNFVR